MTACNVANQNLHCPLCKLNMKHNMLENILVNTATHLAINTLWINRPFCRGIDQDYVMA